MTVPCPALHLLHAATRRLERAGIPGDEARAEARLLLTHATGLTREALRTAPERVVDADHATRFDALVSRRERREPLAYITGEREFYGLSFAVTPAVLIPRPETEFAVEAALLRLQGVTSPRVADVGVGSGAITVAVAMNAPEARVWASDISADALAVAECNARRHGVADRVTCVAGDFLTPLAAASPFDIIVSNPPYVAVEEIAELAPEVRDWEPRIALGIHPDALHFYRRFAAEAPALLADGGYLIVEVGQGQADAVAALWRDAGLVDVEVTRDYGGVPRVVAGRRQARHQHTPAGQKGYQDETSRTHQVNDRFLPAGERRANDFRAADR